MGRRRFSGWWGVAVLAATATGCATAAPPMRACTEIGSPAGVSVTVEPDAVTDGLALTLRICQSDCTPNAIELHPGSITVDEACDSDDPDGSCTATSSPDGSLVGFVPVDSLTAGDVRVSGQLQIGTRTEELAEVTVQAEATYPNGRDCPAGGPQAVVRVTTDGLR